MSNRLGLTTRSQCCFGSICITSQYTDHTYTLSWSRLHFNARQTQMMPPSLTLHVHNVIFVPSPLQRQRDAHATITTSITRTRCYLGSVSISVERQADGRCHHRESHTYLGPISTSTPEKHRQRESPSASHNIHKVILVPSPLEFNARQTQTMSSLRFTRIPYICHPGPVSTSTPGRHRR